MTDSNLELKSKSFIQLRNDFLAGNYDGKWEEHNSAMNELHSKLEDVSCLIPLIESNNRHCQYVAAYIAAQEGDNAASIFEQIFPLIDSRWSEVRDEACGCFLNCTIDPAHYLALLNLLEDEEQSIRLRVITILFGLSKEIITGIYSLTQKEEALTEIGYGMKILMSDNDSNMPQESKRSSNYEQSKIANICSYIAAFKYFGNTEGFKLIATKSDDEDIRKHYKIYFAEG